MSLNPEDFGVLASRFPEQPKLCGRPFGTTTMSFIQGLRPSLLRVIPYGDKDAPMDCANWRVTVWLDADGNVMSIVQEVVVVGSTARPETGP